MDRYKQKIHQDWIPKRSSLKCFVNEGIKNPNFDLCQQTPLKLLSIASRYPRAFAQLLLIEKVIVAHYTSWFYNQYYKALAGLERGSCPLTYRVQAREV